MEWDRPSHRRSSPHTSLTAKWSRAARWACASTRHSHRTPRAPWHIWNMRPWASPVCTRSFRVAYIDHNTLQSGFMNADDHRFIRTIAKKIGVRYSRPGNGICHQVHLERFAKPGKTLIGSDSHTPTAGGIGMPCHGCGRSGRGRGHGRRRVLYPLSKMRRW